MRTLKLFLIASLLALLAPSAFAQGATSTGNPVVVNGVGQPMAGVTVAVCNSYPGAAPTSLCAGGSLATLYTDITLAHACTGTLQALNNFANPLVTSGCSNPGLTDGFGNVVAFSSPGTYWCEYTGSNIIGIVVAVCQFGGGITGVLPQIGDIPRYNVNGDNAWDPVNYAQSMLGIYAVNQTAALQQTGPLGVPGVTFLGASSDQAPTATSQSGKLATAAATASLNTVIGYFAGNNGNVSLLGMLAFYRFSTKFAAGGTTNVRYWMGWGCYNNSGTGGNTATITGTTAYATDTPNKTTIGFRYSAGTDTHWQAVTVVAGASVGSQTTVDTGITPDTNPHLFEMTTNAAGSAVNFFIDSALVATITTNLPNPATNGNAWGDPFFTGDNKNTNNAISATFYYTQIALK